MAFTDTMANRLGFTASQALNYFSSNWEGLEYWYNADKESAFSAEFLRGKYADIIADMVNAKGEENCGGARALAIKHELPLGIVLLIIDDIKELAKLYAENLESQE